MNDKSKVMKSLLSFFASCLFSFNAFGNLEFDQDLSIFKTVNLTSFPQISIPIYKSSGREGPGVLFVHGNSSSARAFHRQIYSKFGKTYKLFFLDLPGHGQASKVDANRPMPMLSRNSPAGFAEYQLGLVEAVSQVANDPDVQAKVLVGWSLGGDVAIMTKGLGLVPDIEALMIMGTAPANVDSPIDEPPFNLVTRIERMIGISAYAGFGLSFNLGVFNPYRFDGKFSDSIPYFAPRSAKKFETRGQAYLDAFFDPNSTSETPRFVVEDALKRSDDRFRASLGAMALGRLPDLKIPNELDIIKSLDKENTILAVVVGENDMFVNKDYLSELKYKKFLPTLWKNEIIQIKDAGHAAQLEQPQVFNQLLEDFLNYLDKI